MIEFPEFLAEVSALEPDGTRTAEAAPRTPYRWQQEFAQACLQGDPPSVVGVPTGSGKTTAVDALVWALAAQLTGGERRTLGVRIVWAIDRRILVDEVHEHASRLALRLDYALTDASDPLHDAAAALAELSGNRPLVATRWRGGLDERTGLQSPLQPEVVTSTVAQIGSRLLFRGYGVGRRSLAPAAGLAASDTTVCLDEAHLADPFRQTAERVVGMQSAGDSQLGLPALRLIELTATPRDRAGGAILLGEEDKRQLEPRWQGAKSATLVEPESEREADRVKVLVSECLDRLAEGTKTLACVVNTVARARRVWSALGAKLGDDADLGLLIGPQRPADRDHLLSPARRSILFDGASPEKPLVVVATQTFEVGLDADVEALVTESASSSALVQRLGRLNRAGESRGRATIVRDAESWLYGEDEQLAWEWLESKRGSSGEIDVSVAALHEDRERPVPSRSPEAPLLAQDVIDRLVQTSPTPHRWAEPDVESFLKGAERDPTADVEICWRSDLRLDATKEGGIAYSRMLIELAPPNRRELLTLNVLSARSLLAGLLGGQTAAAKAAVADTDIEGEAGVRAAIEPADTDNTTVRFLLIRHGEVRDGVVGRGGTEGTVSIGEIEPGDLLVLPTQAGGCGEFGLDPRAERATDVATDVARQGEGSAAAIRLTPGAIEAATDAKGRIPWAGVSSACRSAEQALVTIAGRSQRQAALAKLVDRLAERLPGHNALALLSQRLRSEEELVLMLRGIGPVAEDGTPLLEPFEEGDLDAEVAPSPARDDHAGEEEPAGEDDSAGETGAARESEPLERAWVLAVRETQDAEELDRAALPDPSPPTVADHSLAVRRQLERLVGHLELSPQVKDSLLLAAIAHDLGKADPRFQDFLHGGRAPLGAAPIAKSVFGTRDPKAALVASKIAGLPGGFRHETESVAIVADAARREDWIAVDVDLDLVLVCVGAHHGQGLPVPGVAKAGGKAPRPFGAEVNGAFGTASGDGLDAWGQGEWLERFWRVIDRYGAWGFSYLLGLLVMSDRIVSARGD